MTPREELEPVEPIEHDPTGMRALLSSLPDPGPMPVALEEAILARLGALRDDADDEDGLPLTPSRGPDADIVPLSALGRDRPERRRWFAAVAGIAAAAVLGIVVTDGLQGNGWISSVIGRGDDTTSGSASSGGPMPADQRSDSAAGGGAEAYRVSGSGTDYRAGTLTAQASALLEGHESHVDTQAVPGNAEQCIAALGLSTADAPALDSATYEGRPAYVVVWSRDGRARVVVTEPACGDPGGAHTIVGPTLLD